MANLKDIIYLSNEDYNTLLTTGTVTIGTTTLTYDENCVYITPDSVATTTSDGLMSASDKSKLDNSVVTYTSGTYTVAGTSKTTYTYGQTAIYAPNGLIMGGTAASAGLVTRGVCGVTQPGTGGACTKSQLYLNFDGDNTNNPANRGIVINAGSVGTDLGNGVYGYCAVRGDAMKAWVEAKNYSTLPTVSSSTYDKYLHTNASTGALEWTTVQGGDNYYPTAMSWTNGTTAGPTATITMSGTSNISVGAIPSASASVSGIVTTGAQTFGGAKTFTSTLNIQYDNDNYYGLVLTDTSTGYTASIDVDIGGNHTYTLPDVSGVIALVESLPQIIDLRNA